MRNTVLFFMVLVGLNLKAQEPKITMFHRMLILNEEGKMLVVKIKNKNIWVTPGLYQNTFQGIKQGMDSIATTYGIKVFDIKLRGVFGVKIPIRKYYSTRNLFVMKANSNHTKLPKILDNAQWVSIKESEKLINIQYVNYFIQDVFNNPASIRFGTVERQEVNGKLLPKIVEEFYSLNKN